MSLPHPFVPALRLGVLCIAAACSSTARADDDAPSIWQVSGFGTIGAVHANTDQADFTTSVLKASGAGATNRWSANVDTRLGVQLDVAIAPQWSAVLQAVSEQRVNNSYSPQIEWANVKYQATPDLALRVGRLSLPVYLAGEYRKVGYANTMVRLPVEVYGALPMVSADGVDATWRWRTGDVRQTTRALYGHADITLFSAAEAAQTDDARLRARGVAGLSHSVEVGDLTARASVIGADVTVNLATPLFAALRQFGPAGVALADKYNVDHRRITMVSLGAEYDPGKWYVTIEGERQRSASILGETTSVFVGAGYRWRAFTPYVGYGRVHANVPTHVDGLALGGLPAQYVAVGGVLNAALNQLLMTIPDQSTVSVGVRWDVLPNIALKGQFERVTSHNGSRGMLINTQPGFVSGRPVDVLSLALDFVF